MQDKNQNTNTQQAGQQPTQAQVNAQKTAEAVVNRAAHGDYVTKIVEKIKSSENILVALSKNPSVDEICAAIGLTLFLDELQHHVTAIYSGKTPNALDFLKPEATFEATTDSLQDFIIALNKEKADHLRYKLEGDFVKVYITPYRTTITEEDLTFSRGDFNVDFVIAINVRSAGDLDEALSEHGRIMHDASIVDITRDEPGKFGEIEWSNPVASSVSEMVTQLIFTMQGEDKKLDQDVATALLTGIVAATERFSNNRTSSDTLSLASKLMAMGADQQLIAANVVANRPAEMEVKPEPEPEPEVSSVPSPDTVPEPVMYGAVVLPNVANGIPETAQNVAAMPGATPQVNPAAQAAQSMPEQTNGPAPTPLSNDTFTLPMMTNPAPAVAPAATSDTMQIPTPVAPQTDAAQMTIPQAAMPAAQAVAQPQMPGMSLERPAMEAPKNYADMMQEALQEPLPNQQDQQATVPSEQLVMPPMPEQPEAMPGQPVEKPTDTILPPPPAPTPVLNEDGVPTLPPVQMPPLS